MDEKALAEWLDYNKVVDFDQYWEGTYDIGFLDAQGGLFPNGDMLEFNSPFKEAYEAGWEDGKESIR